MDIQLRHCNWCMTSVVITLVFKEPHFKRCSCIWILIIMLDLSWYIAAAKPSRIFYSQSSQEHLSNHELQILRWIYNWKDVIMIDSSNVLHYPQMIIIYLYSSSYPIIPTIAFCVYAPLMGWSLVWSKINPKIPSHHRLLFVFDGFQYRNSGC